MNNASIVQPYLFFDGKCREAVDFYQSALGAEIVVQLRYKDSPVPMPGPMQPDPDKIMHVQLRIGDTVVMATDGGCGESTTFGGFGLSLTVPTVAELERAFHALSDGGQVRMPPDKTFFPPRFGMVTDRFGVLWMIMVPAAESFPAREKMMS